MAERTRAKTLENGANMALDVLDDHEVSGPLGKLNSVDAGLPRNDLPWDDGGYEPTEEDRILGILAGVGQGGAEGKVSIWKINDQTKKFEYVDELTTTEFETAGLKYLAKKFGAGEYELRIYGSNKKWVAKPRVTVSKAAAQAAQIPEPVSTDLGPLVQTMADGFQQLGQLIVQSRPQAESRTQVLNELMQMKQIFGGEQKGVDPMMMFTQMATLFKQLQPREPGDGIGAFVDLAERFAPTILEAVKSQQTLPAPNPVAIAAPQPAANAAPGPQLSPEQQGAQKMSMQLRLQLGYLCTQAARDADPGPYAAIIADQVPKEVLDALVNDPNWLDALAKFHADVKKFPEWFNELHELVISELSDPGLTEPEETGIQTGTLAEEATSVPGADGDSD